MMEDNPFEPLKSSIAPTAIVVANRKPHSNFEISHNIFRGVFAFIYFGIAPVFIVPLFSDMFEEFGITVPLVTTYVLQFGSLAFHYWYVMLPLSFCIFAGIEFAILKHLKGTSKILVNIIYWLVLLLVAGIAWLAIWMPCQVIHNSISV